MAVLVWIESNNEEPAQALTSSWEVLGKAKELAAALGTEVIALVLGGDSASMSAAAQEYGADAVLVATDPMLQTYRLSAYAATLRQAIEASGATIVLASATTRGRELTASVACALGAGSGAGCGRSAY